MKICFVGHTFHGRTKSSAFMQDILRGLGDLTVLNSSPDDAGVSDDAIIEHYLNNAYDLWVFWQTEYVAARLVPLGLRNAVIAPMYDGAWARPDAFFQQFVTCRFASFSRELHKRLLTLDCRSACFEYWPEPGDAMERSFDRTKWSAFFWERRPQEVPNARTVIQQCRTLSIGKLHLHAAPDFPKDGFGVHGYRFRETVNGVNVSATTWFEDPAEYHAVSTTPLFYFAPRLYEGIGMATLEAMARGQIVVAPDRPTANQYIGHLSSGILYDPDRPYALPIVNEPQAAELSRAARTRVARGREEWEMDRDRLVSFLLEDGRRWANSDLSAHFGNRLRRAVRARRLKDAK